MLLLSCFFSLTFACHNQVKITKPLVINLAASLSILGQNNLVIDLDPQGNATTGLGKSNSDETKNIYNLLIKKINRYNILNIVNILKKLWTDTKMSNFTGVVKSHI